MISRIQDATVKSAPRVLVSAASTVRVLATVLSAAVLLAPPSSVAQTSYTWTANGGTTDWHTAANWSPPGGPPGADDTANIANGANPYVVEISTDTAECGSLILGSMNVLYVIGQGLTLGAGSDPTTTSSIAGTVFLQEGALKGVTITINDEVELEGGGLIRAAYGDNDSYRPAIVGADSGDLLVVSAVNFRGHMCFEVDLLHSYASDPAASNFSGVFGAFNSNEVMSFGISGEMDISAASNAPTYLEAENNGELEFYTVTFDGNETGAPNWYAYNGDILVDDAAGNTYFVEVPFDIHAKAGAELRFEHDFSCAGKLTLDATNNPVVVTAVDGVIVDVYTP